MVIESVEASDEILNLPGVVVIAEGEAPAEVLKTLNPAETLFVSAWVERSAKPKTRPGDKLSWDAPGFQPPDPPQEAHGP